MKHMDTSFTTGTASIQASRRGIEIDGLDRIENGHTNRPRRMPLANASIGTARREYLYYDPAKRRTCAADSERLARALQPWPTAQ